MKSKLQAESCVPFILIALYLLYPTLFTEISHSILGKTVLVFLIIYYTNKHFVYGLAFCTLVILFMFLNPRIPISKETFQSSNLQQHLKYLPKPHKNISHVNNNFHENEDSKHTICNIAKAYPENISEIKADDETNFRKKYCSTKNVMQYKNLDIKHNSISQHVSNIQFNDNVCNPCDNNCHFTLNTKKEDAEDELLPENTRSLLNFIPDKVRQLILFKTSGEPFSGCATYLK